jgi:hypothetical protein
VARDRRQRQQENLKQAVRDAEGDDAMEKYNALIALLKQTPDDR